MSVIDSAEPHLPKRLGIVFALAVGLGSMIGTGIMRTPGPVADQVPEIWIILTLWGLGGLHVLLAANICAEIFTAMPRAGGLFIPVQAAFGDSMGLLSGWVNWLAYNAAGAALAIVCGNFLAVIFPWLTPYMVPVAIGILALVYLLNWLGVREGAAVQTFGSLVKALLIIGLIGLALLADPLVPPVAAPAFDGGGIPAVGTPSPTIVGISLVSIILAYQMVYGAYAGWESCVNFAEEDRNALRNIPRALALSILAVTTIYVAFNISLVTALDMETLRHSDLPVALVLESVFGRTGGVVVAVLAVVFASTSLNAQVMMGPRVLFGMSRNRLFPAFAMRLNAGGTPHVAMALTGIFTLLLVLSGGFEFIFRLMGALAIFCFIMLEASLFALRRNQPDLPRPFRAIGYPLLPAFVLLLDTALLVAFIYADPTSGLTMVALIAICMPVGVILQRRRSRASIAASAAT